MQLLAAKFAQIATAIDTTNAQIAALQAKLSELQEHQQQLLSVEQACQSALSQVDTALAMLNHVNPCEISTFKDALVSKFNSEAIALIAPAPTDTDTDTAPAPTAPTAPENTPVIDVNVNPTPPNFENFMSVIPKAEPTSEIVPDTAPDTTEDIEKSLNKLSLPSFRKLAKSKNLDSRLNRTTLTARLKVLVTKDEVLALS